MTDTDGGGRMGRTWPWMLMTLFALASLSVLALAQPEGNVMKSLRTDRNEIEIHLTSPRPFGVRNALIVLWIGGQRFTKSRPPEDGSLNTLIFTLTPEQFARVAPGDRVVVQYGDEPGWDFGPFDKRLSDERSK